MPTPGKDESREDFVSRCIEAVMDDGSAKDTEQAAAICYSKWRENEKGKSIALSVTLKTDPTSGRVRWKAIANSGEFDQQGDRFDETFFDDIVKNFWTVQDAVSRSNTPPPGYAHPDGMPVQQLDVAHYSFQLSQSERVLARAGVPTFAYRDGKKLIMQGHFEDTPLGKAASKSVLADDKDFIKTSIGVWPDWNRVEIQDSGRRIFRGGNGAAYGDHLALTAYPVDARTEISAEGEPMEKSLTVADDAMQVLQDPELVRQLEEARASAKSGASIPDGALVKADESSKVSLNVEGDGPPDHDMMIEAYKELKKLFDDQNMPLPSNDEKKNTEEKPVAESIVTITTEHSDATTTTVEKDKAADAIDELAAQLAAQATAPESEPQETESPVMMSLAKEQSEAISAIKALSARLDALEKSIPNLSTIIDLSTALNKSIEATKATEAQKVKSLLDNRGWLNMAQLYSARSATDNTIDGGSRAKGPQETESPAQVGGPIAGRFIRT